METALRQHRAEIAALCERFGVTRLEVFGSAADGSFEPGRSDYDFLVELDADADGSLARRWIGLAQSLEALLSRPVDLVSPGAIRNPYFAAEVQHSRRLVYERSPAQTPV